jgi:trehalose 6-phosphate phosphatase
MVQTVVNTLLAAYQHGGKLALLFDYDGTLTPIVEHPSEAILPPARKELLARLAQEPRILLGLLSGRSLDDLKNLVGLRNVYYAGTGGFELDLLDRRVVHPDAEKGRSLIQNLVGPLQRVVPAFKGAWIENKQYGLTVHYRGVAEDQISLLQAKVQEIFQPSATLLRVLHGPMAIEVTPVFGWTKGAAVQMIVQAIGPGTFPFYAGDASNDMDAMEVVTALGGIAVGIGPQAPLCPQYRLPGADALFNLLVQFFETLHAA